MKKTIALAFLSVMFAMNAAPDLVAGDRIALATQKAYPASPMPSKVPGSIVLAASCRSKCTAVARKCVERCNDGISRMTCRKTCESKKSNCVAAC